MPFAGGHHYLLSAAGAAAEMRRCAWCFITLRYLFAVYMQRAAWRCARGYFTPSLCRAQVLLFRALIESVLLSRRFLHIYIFIIVARWCFIVFWYIRRRRADVFAAFRVFFIVYFSWCRAFDRMMALFHYVDICQAVIAFMISFIMMRWRRCLLIPIIPYLW